MKKKVLIVTHLASMVSSFLMPNIKLLSSIGYEVEVASNFKQGSTCSDYIIKALLNSLSTLKIKTHQVDFNRNPLSMSNLRAYKTLYKIIKEGNFTLIHCHNPISGVCARIIAHKKNIPVIYTVHGFHFYKGAPLINWLIYYPIEYLLSYYTDVLITINHEDYNRRQLPN